MISPVNSLIFVRGEWDNTLPLPIWGVQILATRARVTAMSDEWTPEESDAHECVWKSLYDKASAVLDRFGRNGYRETDDYWIVDDDWGWNVLQIELQDAILLRPDLVSALQALLAHYPDWLIHAECRPARAKRCARNGARDPSGSDCR